MKITSIITAIVFWLIFMPAAMAMQLAYFNGEDTSLEQHIGNGKWSVVVFWSHDCGICRHETPALNAFHRKHENQDAQVLGVSIDGAKNRHKAEQFIQQTTMAFPTFIGELVLLAADFYQLSGEPFRGTPSFLLFNPKGELMGMQAGPVRMVALEEFIANN